MPTVENTTSAAEYARARRNEIERRARDFEPELTPAEIEAEGLAPVVTASGITFYIEPAVCLSCADGYHEQPALCACDCPCHGAATPRKPATNWDRYMADTLPLRTRRAA
ncbi:MAG: hypothetical protein V4502_06100 [Pseudomonadota bacterium]